DLEINSTQQSKKGKAGAFPFLSQLISHRYACLSRITSRLKKLSGERGHAVQFMASWQNHLVGLRSGWDLAWCSANIAPCRGLLIWGHGGHHAHRRQSALCFKNGFFQANGFSKTVVNPR
ncbi:MAG: hypothetical protein ACXVKL_10640, partial [Candidatus Angelobacter sp.]